LHPLIKLNAKIFKTREIFNELPISAMVGKILLVRKKCMWICGFFEKRVGIDGIVGKPIKYGTKKLFLKKDVP
jgi:hypothetical protein